MKNCEICNKEIPEDYQNALCADCYTLQVQENEQRVKDGEDDKKKAGYLSAEEFVKQSSKPHEPASDVDTPKYTKNPPQDQIEQLERNYIQYRKSGQWLGKSTRTMYEFIRDSFIDIVKGHRQYPKFIWKPTVIDIGCGSGLGSNIISQEADFVWGIDKNEVSVHFANEMFKRLKNNIYYTPEIRFDLIDVVNPPPNVEMKFDVAVAIEVFEHLEDYENLFKFMKIVMRPNSMAWISTPNRNNKAISDVKPKNKYHVYEPTQEEFMEILSKHFGRVEFFNSAGEPVGDTTNHTPLLALCQEPKI